MRTLCDPFPFSPQLLGAQHEPPIRSGCQIIIVSPPCIILIFLSLLHQTRESHLLLSVKHLVLSGLSRIVWAETLRKAFGQPLCSSCQRSGPWGAGEGSPSSPRLLSCFSQDGTGLDGTTSLSHRKFSGSDETAVLGKGKKHSPTSPACTGSGVSGSPCRKGRWVRVVRGDRGRPCPSYLYAPAPQPLLGPLSSPEMAFSSPLPPGQQWSSSKTQIKGPHLQEALSGVPGRLLFPAHSRLGPKIPRVFLVPVAKCLVKTQAQCKSQVQVGESTRRQVEWPRASL